MNKLIIESLSGERLGVLGTIQIVELGDRIKRSAKFVCLGLGLTLVSLPLPGLHFFLVPSFLMFTILVGIKKINEKYRIELSDVACPVCSRSIKESIIYAKNPMLRIYCYECRTQLRILPA